MLALIDEQLKVSRLTMCSKTPDKVQTLIRIKNQIDFRMTPGSLIKWPNPCKLCENID